MLETEDESLPGKKRKEEKLEANSKIIKDHHVALMWFLEMGVWFRQGRQPLVLVRLHLEYQPQAWLSRSEDRNLNMQRRPPSDQGNSNITVQQELKDPAQQHPRGYEMFPHQKMTSLMSTTERGKTLMVQDQMSTNYPSFWAGKSMWF